MFKKREKTNKLKYEMKKNTEIKPTQTIADLAELKFQHLSCLA